MMTKKRVWLIAELMVLSSLAFGQVPPPPKLDPVPDNAPAVGGEVRSGNNANDNTEPTVTIRQEGDNQIEEFSINGRHYATRVTPKGGVPYMLVDPDGNGRMTPTDDVPARLRPPQWTLFKF